MLLLLLLLQGAYRGVFDLIAGAEEHLGSSLSLFVFNKERECVRNVALQPCDDWGGEGWWVAVVAAALAAFVPSCYSFCAYLCCCCCRQRRMHVLLLPSCCLRVVLLLLLQPRL